MTSNVYQPGRSNWGSSALTTKAGPVVRVAFRSLSIPTTQAEVPLEK